jgi:hypothetical protein
MTLQDLRANWQDTPEYHKQIHEEFTELVNIDPMLDAHRTYIENHIFGMGERSFQYLWKILLNELPENPKLLEIGVHKGQILSLWKLLKPDADVYGITPLDGQGTGWRDDDYLAHIINIHKDFELDKPAIHKGVSESSSSKMFAESIGELDCLYIDGGHERRHIDNDLSFYAPLVKSGGFMVIDDACCDMKMPWGYFQGIVDVTEGVLAYMNTFGDEWEFMGNVVHLRIYRRK